MQAQLVKKLRDLTGSAIIHCKKALEECNNDLGQAQEWLRLKGVSQAHKKLYNTTGAGLIAGYLSASSGYLLEVLCETDFVAKTDLFQSFTKDVLKAWTQSSVGFSNIGSLYLPSYKLTIEEAKLQAISKTQENLQIRRGIKYECNENSAVGLYLHNTIDPLLGLSGCLLKIKSENPLKTHRERVNQLAYNLSMQVIASKPLFLKKSDIPAEYLQKEKATIELQLDEKTKTKPQPILESIVQGKIEKSLDQVTLLEQIFMISEDSEEKPVKKVIQDLSAEISNNLEIEEYSTFSCETLNK
jgi:elongation factor Ts